MAVGLVGCQREAGEVNATPITKELCHARMEYTERRTRTTAKSIGIGERVRVHSQQIRRGSTAREWVKHTTHM